jgi:hypothetical protein
MKLKKNKFMASLTVWPAVYVSIVFFWLAVNQTIALDCPANTWPCSNGIQCINSTFKCNSIIDCSDGSDEGAICS